MKWLTALKAAATIIRAINKQRKIKRISKRLAKYEHLVDCYNAERDAIESGVETIEGN